MQIGITERGDAALNLDWRFWVETLSNPAILITKDPLKLSTYLSKDMNIIVHCTITGLPRELEPNVPNTENQISGLEKIQSIIGYERVVLRVDPIIVEGYGCAMNIIKLVKVNRLRISFLDYYSHVKERFIKNGFNLQQDFHAPLQDRLNILNEIKKIYPNVEVCGEPNIACTGCISMTDLKLFGVEEMIDDGNKQRASCSCLANKKELLTGITRQPCEHGCLYCYWK